MDDSLQQKEPEEVHRILLVDDQAAIRKMMSRILQMNGYTVVEASDGLEALELLATPVTFNAIISDVCMPRLSGLEMAKELRARGDTRPVIFISGFVGDSGDTDLEETGFALIKKPFALSELLVILDGLLSR